MMLASLRGRLWLSYAMLIGLALTIVALGLFWALLRSPLLYRQSVFRLRLVGIELSTQVDTLLDGPADALESFVQEQADERQVRLVLFRADGEILMDTGSVALVRLPPVETRLDNQDAIRAFMLRDEQRRVWVAVLQPLISPYHLLVAMPRPVLPLRTILRDEVVSPLIWAGVMALVVAFVLSLFIAGWIANPLQRMAARTRSVSSENFTPLPLEGPAEVQQLAHSFNEMMERVQSSQQSQREFMANVSHELKTPLTSIQGFSQAILDGTLKKPEDLRQAGRVINEESGRMNRLVADLLALARLEAGTADLQRAPVNLRALLTSVAEKFSFQSQAAQITLATDLKNAPVVAGDEDRLMQVFNNLMDNAIRFTPAGGKVTLGSEAKEGFALVRVADTGVGIDPSEQQRIFDRFYQVDHARSGGAGRGVGLGLAIARQIVLAHQGKIWLESAVGQGTTFYVQLPLAAAEKNKR